MTNESPISLAPSRSARRWLTESQTAERLNLSKKWLQAQRLKGGGIRYAKFGSAVRYSLADIEEYEAKCLRLHTSDTGNEAGEGC